jgi:5-methyltetrahydropteroyltriglutamate--homocysteine methyltransferase
MGDEMSLDNVGLFFDDIGSYPLPKGIRLDDISQEQYMELVKDALAQKIASGVEVPTYPQFRDMIKMFLEPIEKIENQESPYLIKKEAAEILELHAVPTGRQVRVCVTGPVELYLHAFGATNYTDILCNLAESVARFLERAQESGKMAVASLDEPSLGISSAVVFDEEEIQNALEIASRPCKGMDCEVHLHSPLYAELCTRVPGLSIIGVESAAHPDYLKLIDRKILEDTDTYLRAGIARTDILSMVASLNDRLGINLWEDPARLEKEILAMESPQAMENRLDATYRAFGDRLRAAGPDCGLGSWPSQSMANKLLSNIATAIASYRRKK